MGWLVGRAEEMSYLAEGLAHRGLTTLVGSAGIGKTTLAREALERRRYVEGGALRSLRWRPYLPFERALSRAFTGEPDEVADEVISRAGDAVLFIDDLHWADERCIAALDLVIAHLTVVATARDAELDARANTLVGKGRRIDVRALADTDARRLAHRLHPDLVDTVIEELLAVANGNPLLLEVLADEEAPSRTLLDGLAARMENLDAHTIDALARLALAGRPLGREVVALAGDAGGLIREVGGGVELRHALLADALLEMIAPDRRRQLHLDLGKALRGAEAAVHLLSAGEPDAALAAASEALETTTDASSRAQAAYLVAVAHAEAGHAIAEAWVTAATALIEAGRYTDAIDAAERVVADAPERAEALFARGRALWFAGDVDGAICSFDGALSLLPDGAPLAVRVLVERAYLAVRDRRPRALDEAQRAFEAAAGHPIEELRARAVLGATLLYGGQAGWDEVLTSAVADANAIGDADLACTAAFHLSSGLGFVGRLREAADVALAQSQIAEREGLTTWRLHFLAALALDRVMLGEELEWVVDTSSRLIAQHPLFRNRYELEGSLVFALYDLGRVDDARARAEQHSVCAESDEGRIFAATVLSEVDWMAGDDLSVMQRAIGVRPLGDAWFGMRFLTELAGFHAAVQLGTAFEPQLPGLVLPLHWAGLNEIEGLRRWVAGDIAGALAALDEAADGWLDVAIPRWAVRVLGASAVLARRARTSDSAKRWEHAVATAERFGIRHHLRRWDDSGSGLTRREEQVLRLVATGRTSTEIATELGIAPRTVDDHVESARQKLGAPTRRAAVRRIVGR